MNTLQLKERIHRYIDQADEHFLRQLYTMIECEQDGKDFFKETDQNMVSRAKASIESVEQGKTRSIQSFKKDIESWNNSRFTRSR